MEVSLGTFENCCYFYKDKPDRLSCATLMITDNIDHLSNKAMFPFKHYNQNGSKRKITYNTKLATITLQKRQGSTY